MKKGLNIPIIATAVVSVCLVAVVAVLGVKAKNGGITASNDKNAYDSSVDYNTINTEDTGEYDYSYADYTFSAVEEENSASVPASTVTLPTESTTKKSVITAASKVQEKITNAITTTSKVSVDLGGTTIKAVEVEDATIPVLDESQTKRSSGAVASATLDSNLPKDMYFSGLHSQGYSVIGPKGFIYNDDTSPNCTQRKFGYNVLYDAGAKLIDFSIETCRVKFNYDSKEYMIQMWKGQYISGDIGTVGGEIGIYTRPLGTVSSIGHYSCADEDDWLYMELTCYWDEKGDGNYIPQFTRKYAKHWWETGYVDGQLANRKDSSPLRLLHRITFKDEEQAAAFEKALIKEGFKSVGTFNPMVKDTCKRYGKDVIYIWQDVR